MKGSISERCGCIVIKEGGLVSLSMKLSNEDIPSIPSLSILYRFEIYKLPTYPLIRLYLELFDNPERDPIKGEVLFDVENDKEMLNLLCNQPLLNIHFFNEENKYTSSKEISFFFSQRDMLTNIINEANNFLSSISKPDIALALKDFYLSFPL
jgi:hypothetical protein